MRLRIKLCIFCLCLIGCRNSDIQSLSERVEESTRIIDLMDNDLLSKSWNLATIHRNKALDIDKQASRLKNELNEAKKAEYIILKETYEKYIDLINNNLTLNNEKTKKLFQQLNLLDSMIKDKSIEPMVINGFLTHCNSLVLRYLYAQTDMACPGPFAFSEPRVFVIPQLRDNKHNDSLTVKIFVGVRNKTTLIPLVTISNDPCNYLAEKGISRCIFPLENMNNKSKLCGNLIISNVNCIGHSYECKRHYSFCCKIK